MKSKKSLNRTLMTYLLLLGITLVICLSIGIGILYKRAVVRESNSTVSSFCMAASDYIDGEKLKTYYTESSGRRILLTG